MKVNKRFLTVALSSSVSSNKKIRLPKDLPNYQKFHEKETDTSLKKSHHVQNDKELNDKMPQVKKIKIGEWRSLVQLHVLNVGQILVFYLYSLL